MIQNEKEIRENYKRMGVSLTYHDKFLGGWAAQSQYGYPLAWFDNERDAEAHALNYYDKRMNLIRQ